MADPSHSSPTAATARGAVVAPAALDEPGVVLPAAAPAVDAEFGFQRQDFGKEKLAGTVEFHERHLFFCYGRPEEWPSDIQTTDFDHLPGLLAAAIEARKPDLKKTTKLTLCEGELYPGDVLMFPDMIQYRGITQSTVNTFVEEVLVKDVEWLHGSRHDLAGSYVFVCAHGSQDNRCGVCGPALVTRFKDEIVANHLDGQVAVAACSDPGGHKYAGHVMIFSSDAKGEVAGHWYGYVAPGDVPALLHKHIGQGEIMDHLWRGQLGISEQQQREALVCTEEHEPGSIMQGKLLIPANFNDDKSLDHSAVHGFDTARQLKDAVNATKKWLTTNMAAGLLTNGSVFAVEPRGISDESYQVNGAVCVIRNEGLLQIKPTNHLYTTSNVPLQKRKPGKPVPIGEMYITRQDLSGNRWTLRKFSIEGDSRFHILQWRPRVPDNEYHEKKSIQSPVKVMEHEDEPRIVNSIAMIEDIPGLSNTDKAKAIMILKDEENQIILASIKSRDLRMSWLLEEIKNQERVWERGEGRSGP